MRLSIDALARSGIRADLGTFPPAERFIWGERGEFLRREDSFNSGAQLRETRLSLLCNSGSEPYFVLWLPRWLDTALDEACIDPNGTTVTTYRLRCAFSRESLDSFSN